MLPPPRFSWPEDSDPCSERQSPGRRMRLPPPFSRSLPMAIGTPNSAWIGLKTATSPETVLSLGDNSMLAPPGVWCRHRHAPTKETAALGAKKGREIQDKYRKHIGRLQEEPSPSRGSQRPNRVKCRGPDPPAPAQDSRSQTDATVVAAARDANQREQYQRARGSPGLSGKVATGPGDRQRGRHPI